MFNISFFAASLVIETLLLLLVTAGYFIYRYRRTQTQLRKLNQQLRSLQTTIASQTTTLAEEDVSDNKQMIIDVLLEKLDCFDENNSELEDFRQKFLSLREDFSTLRSTALAEQEQASSDSGTDQQNIHLQEKFTSLEQELQHILKNATTIVGQINREKMSGK